MRFTAAEFAAREAAIVESGQLLRGPSLAERVAAAGGLEGISPLDGARLVYEWAFWARPKQLAPAGDWVVWLVLGGRALGKNRLAAEWVRGRIERGEAKSIALIGPDWKDVRRYMVGGQRGAGGSGLLDVWPPWDMPEFVEHKAELHFSGGAIAYLNTAEQKELRGANLDTIWADEIGKWKYAEALWNNAELTLRDVGAVRPQAIMTTTPTAMALLRQIIMDPGTAVTHGAMLENAANLAPSYVERMLRRFGGTRLGLQELDARILSDNPDALFALSLIEAHRVTDEPDVLRRAVGVDPAVSEKRKSDETGIVCASVDRDGHMYVLADMSGKMSPDGWAKASVDLALAWHADFFVVERNKIGDLAKHNIAIELRARGLLGEYEIREAYSMTDKAARAAPVASLYEQGRVHHVGRRLGALEAEITEWNPKTGRSPNRLDALVHVAFELVGLAGGEEPKEDPSLALRGFAALNRYLEAPTGLGELVAGAFTAPRGRTI